MSEKRKKYDREFREGAVRIVRETVSRSPRSRGTWGSTRALWAIGSPRTARPGRAKTAAKFPDLAETRLHRGGAEPRSGAATSPRSPLSPGKLYLGDRDGPL